MYGYNGFNSPNVPKIPRLTKSVAEQCIAEYLGVQTHYLKFARLQEKPQVWKHACTNTGVNLLVPQRFIYYTGQVIDFTVCPVCGKIVYYFDVI